MSENFSVFLSLPSFGSSVLLSAQRYSACAFAHTKRNQFLQTHKTAGKI